MIAGGIPVDPSGVGAHARPSQFRIRLARFLQVVLPITGISLLTYAFTHPDAEPLIPNRLPPQLQYLAAQQTPNEEVVTNWSGTHDAKPKWVWGKRGRSVGEGFREEAWTWDVSMGRAEDVCDATPTALRCGAAQRWTSGVCSAAGGGWRSCPAKSEAGFGCECNSYLSCVWGPWALEMGGDGGQGGQGAGD